MSSKKKRIVIAFDVEAAGARTNYTTFAIGVSVVNEKLDEIESGRWTCYEKESIKFEERCWTEFWANKQNILELLINDDNLTFDDKERNMIQEFVKFVKKWQLDAFQKNYDLFIVSDNKIFDGERINALIMKYFPEDDLMPLPYNFNNKEYSSFWETHSMQKGFLMALSSKYIDTNWGFSNEMEQLFTVPSTIRKPTHLPEDDAYTIARDMQILLGVAEGRFLPRSQKKKITNYLYVSGISLVCGYFGSLLYQYIFPKK